MKRTCEDCGVELNNLKGRWLQNIPLEKWEEPMPIIRCTACGQKYFDSLISYLPKKPDMVMCELAAYEEDMMRGQTDRDEANREKWYKYHSRYHKWTRDITDG